MGFGVMLLILGGALLGFLLFLINMGNIVRIYGRNWRGESPAWKVFWLRWAFDIYVAACLLCITILVALIASLFIGKSAAVVFLVSILAFIPLIVYVVQNINWTVSLWRCAFNARWRGWGYFTRTFIALYASFFWLFPIAYLSVTGKWSDVFEAQQVLSSQPQSIEQLQKILQKGADSVQVPSQKALDDMQHSITSHEQKLTPFQQQKVKDYCAEKAWKTFSATQESATPSLSRDEYIGLCMDMAPVIIKRLESGEKESDINLDDYSLEEVEKTIREMKREAENIKN